MKSKYILGTLILLVLLAGVVWIARPGKNRTANQARLNQTAEKDNLTAAETFYDFGSISMAAGKVSRVFPVKNTGSNLITIEKMYTSCMCTTAILRGKREWGPYGMPGHGFTGKMKEELNPGEEARVEVIFDPAAHGPAGVGRIERSVYLEDNTGANLELQFTATVTP